MSDTNFKSAEGLSSKAPAMTARDISEAIDELILRRADLRRVDVVLENAACIAQLQDKIANLKIQIAEGLAEHSVYGTIFAEPKKAAAE